MSNEDIEGKRGLGYAKGLDEARRLRRLGRLRLRVRPETDPGVEQVREVAAAGETMPPKSTFFFPKLLTGMVFNPLS